VVVVVATVVHGELWVWGGVDTPHTGLKEATPQTARAHA
jgi:hypothetical protein